MLRIRPARRFAVAALLAACSLAASAQDGSTLKKIRDTGAITLGHRESSFGFSYTDEQVREFAGPMLAGDAPSGVASNATASGTDIAGYLTEGPGFSAFADEDGVVYHTYSTQARGLEFLMGYYPILDRAPKGRDEGEGQAELQGQCLEPDLAAHRRALCCSCDGRV